MGYRCTYALVFENHTKLVHGASCFGGLRYDSYYQKWGNLNKLVYHLLPTSLLPHHIRDTYNFWCMTVGSHIVLNDSVESLDQGVAFAGTTPFLQFLYMASCLRVQVENPSAILAWYELYTKLIHKGIPHELAGAKAVALMECSLPTNRELYTIIHERPCGTPRGYVGGGYGFLDKDLTEKTFSAHSPTPLSSIVTSSSILSVFRTSSPTISEMVMRRKYPGEFAERLRRVEGFTRGIEHEQIKNLRFLPINEALVNRVAEMV